jgi:hypothetical protein
MERVTLVSLFATISQTFYQVSQALTPASPAQTHSVKSIVSSMESSLASFILGDLVLFALDGKLAIFDTVGITSELVSKCRFDEVIRTSVLSSADQNLPNSRTVEAPLARILCEIVKAYYDIPNLAITVLD